MSPQLPLLTLAAALLVAGCGSSDDTTPTASTPAAATPTAPAAAPASDGPIKVTAKDFAFDATALTAKAGKVTIDLANDGPSEHELVLLKTDQAPGALKVTGGRVDEGASVGEISETGTGKTGSHTFDLKPGKYVFVCNIPGHYGDGMRGELVVR